MRCLTTSLALVLWMGVWPCAQAERHSLLLDGDWQFQRHDVEGAMESDVDTADWQTVRLPHTWNAPDAERGGAYYRGVGWYRHVFEGQGQAGAGRQQFLEFDAATMAAEVWINGQKAGQHAGGYSRFRIDITPWLRHGRNVLAVRVDNGALPDVAPLGGDFSVFGGLIRPVRLIDTDAVHIDLLDHGGPGIQIDTESLDADLARLSVRVTIRNDGRRAAKPQLHLSVLDATGQMVAEAQQSARVKAQRSQLVEMPLQIQQPHRWQGVDDPYLYRLRVEVRDGETLLDAHALPIGLRQFSVDAQRGFLLNGRPYPLHGVNYFHPGRPGIGVAVGDAQIDEDMGILQSLGATGLRLVHYPHPERVYERADQLGLVLWTEIPLNSAMQETASFRDNLRQQLRELIRQQRHHAAVAIWGVGNEVYRSDEPIVRLLGELHQLAKQEDSSRLTAYANCCAADDHPMALQTDLAAYNRYWGWYDGSLQDIGDWADRLHALHSDLPIGLGEYGAGGSVQHQQEPPVRPEAKSHWHPEQYQALFHEAYARQLAQRPFLWGHFVWLAFDHASAGRDEGDRPGINDKGLVSYDRRERKDAFYLLQAWWQREPVLHIASRRFTPRPAGVVTVKAYSNAHRLTLSVDDQFVGEAEVVDRVAIWPDLDLPPGPHRIQVQSDHGLLDTVVWELQP